MSLYIGNLSPRVRKEELESVFGRFGRCNIRLKDGYGFAIYGIRAQAEVALKALRGRNICGLPISLSWSNKQPNAPQSFNRGARSYEMQQGRGFERRDDLLNVPLRSNARQHYKFRQPDGDARRVNSNDLHVEKGSTDHVSEEREVNGRKEDGQDRSDNADCNLLDSDRWRAFGRLSNDSHIDDGTTFDRYKPDRDYEPADQEGGNPMLHDISPGKEISEGKLKRMEAVDVASSHQNIPRKNQGCFKCGNLGHKIRDCPMQDASHVRNVARTNNRQGSVVNNRHKGRIESEEAEPSSRRRLCSTLTKERVRSRKDSGSGRYQRVKRRRSSLVSTDYNDHVKAHGQRKRSEDGNETFNHRHGERTRRSLSRSTSRSFSASSSHSSSTSRSSVSYSSSRFRSDSKSNQLKSRSVKSKSTSRSSSPTSLSLSVSLGQPVSSPPNKTEVNLNSSLDISKSLQTKPNVLQEMQHLEVSEDNNGCGNTRVDVQSDLVLMQEGLQLEVVSREETVASRDTGVAVQDENTLVCVDVQDDIEIDKLQKNDGKYLAEPRISNGNNDQPTASLEEEHIAVGNSSQVFREESELQTQVCKSYPMKSDSKVTSTMCANTTISLDELDRIIKHYNLKHTEETGGYLSIEEYFGCARMWPWEIIYYRRLKKGAISVENYARRLAQNREFDITDKYIRSSSGWGEPTQELDSKDFASL